MKTPTPKYRIRKIGSKHDYIRRYGVIGPQGRRADGVRGGLTKDRAQDLANDLNERYPAPLEGQ